MSEPPTIVVIDDHVLLAETLVAALRAVGIRATAVRPERGTDLLGRLIAIRPDLLLLDLDLGGFGDSTTLIRPLTAAGIRVLIVTGLPDRMRIALALEQGAIGYQSKADGFDTLLQAANIALNASGESWRPQERVSLLHDLNLARTANAESTRQFRRLTDRERATLGALCDGLTVSEIAHTWVVSEATVRSHVQRILSKLGVASQVQAVVLTLQSGWLEPAGAASGG